MTLSFRFGTVGSPLDTPKKPGGSVGAIQYLRTLGLDTLELGWVRAVRVTPETCTAIRQEAATQDVSISVHAPYFINLNADDEEWPKSRQRLMDAAVYGSLAGATDIVFHPGSYFGLPPEAVLPLAIERLHGCQEELRLAGNPVRLRPETMGKSAMLGSLADTLAMSRGVPGVEPCVDFAHLHARPGDGSVNTYPEFAGALEQIAEALGTPALRSLHIHLSGIAYGPKGEKEHLELKDADLNFKELFRALADFNCGGRILCESPVMEADALLLKSTWCEISGEG
jgi:deoxyribonuclease-4